MHETEADLLWLDRLIDSSHQAGGPHLQRVFQPQTRIGAEELVALMTAMQVLSVATVSRQGRPMISAVDGFVYRGRWYFGSALDSLKVIHLRARPWISLAHNRSDDLSVVVHGQAAFIDLAAGSNSGLAGMMADFYGSQWAPDPDAAYLVVEPERMFTFRNTYK